MILPVYKENRIVNRSCHEIMAGISRATYNPQFRKRGWSYDKSYIFMGEVWSNAFKITNNTYSRNSFAPFAKGTVRPIDSNHTEVNIEIGPLMFVVVFMSIWGSGVLFFAAFLIYELFTRSTAGGLIVGFSVLALFIAVAAFFIRFGFFHNCKILRNHINEILS